MLCLNMSIHQLMDIWIISVFGLLWTVLLDTFVKKFCSDACFSFLSMHSRMKFLDYMVILHLTFFLHLTTFNVFSLVVQMVKRLPGNAGDLGSIPRLGGSPGEGNGNPLQYSFFFFSQYFCLENPIDGGA